MLWKSMTEVDFLLHLRAMHVEASEATLEAVFPLVWILLISDRNSLLLVMSARVE